MSVLYRAATVTVSLALLSAPLAQADEPLVPGCAKPPITFSGAGSGVTTQVTAFEAAIGGVNNGGTASPQNGGFRTINWDAVLLDGTDFSGQSTTIVASHVVAIPINRFMTRGVIFDRPHAVANDGFSSVNAGATGQFPAFSPSNTFAPFNNNTVSVTFALAAPTSATQTTAATTKGFGAVFLDVEAANTTSIEFFNGTVSLGKYFAPTSTSGQPSFLGVLFASPIVTSVTITLGTAQIFNYNGSVTTGGTDSPPGSDLVALDDFIYAEPTTQVPVALLTGTAGHASSGTVGTFTDTDPNGSAGQFNAIIDWGDLTSSTGTIVQNPSGCFDVSGTHTYAAGGTYVIFVSVADLFIRSLTMAATGSIGALRFDFNHDGRGDILLNNTVTGDVAEWQMNGTAVAAGAVVSSPGASWSVRAIGDLNRDGNSDIVLQNASGDVAGWLMNGFTISSGNIIGSPGSSFVIVGSGDFDGDGKSDLLLRNSSTGDLIVWLMSGLTITSGGVAGSPGTAWSVAAIGDFNGDGKSDILLRNNTSGDIAEWQMNGIAISAGSVVASPGTAWTVRAADDLNADGRADIILQDTSGNVAGWLMNGFTVTSGAIVGTPGATWTVSGSADFNADGKSDILLRDTSGNLAVWLMNGLTISSGGVAGSPGTSWVPVMK